MTFVGCTFARDKFVAALGKGADGRFATLARLTGLVSATTLVGAFCPDAAMRLSASRAVPLDSVQLCISFEFGCQGCLHVGQDQFFDFSVAWMTTVFSGFADFPPASIRRSKLTLAFKLLVAKAC